MTSTPSPAVSPDLGERLLRFDGWLETMHAADGYGGPVVHWWNTCLQFTGAGLDWRYEGILIAYVTLYRQTRQTRWLARAKRSADELVRGQLPSGNFRNSSFELNPYAGGRPHEAAAVHGLLTLAQLLKEEKDADWEKYTAAGEKNLRDFSIGWLWNEKTRAIYDSVDLTSFVPNKAATAAEALFLLATLRGDAEWAEKYALPTLDLVIAHQVQEEPARGAVYQLSIKGKPVAWYFPYYIARCATGLLAGYQWSKQEKYLEAAKRALEFVVRWRDGDGGFAQVVYNRQRVNRYQKWIAGAGDMLNALRLIEPYGFNVDTGTSQNWLLQGQTSMGGFRSAYGFARQTTQRQPPALPEFRDLVPVCGWSDKAFRYLSALLPAGANLPEKAALKPFESECLYRGKRMVFREDENVMELRHRQAVIYRFRKQQDWAEVWQPDIVWK